VFLLDTDHITIIQRQPRSPLVARIKEQGPHHFFVSIVSFQEQALGWNAYLNRARTDDRILHSYRMFERILRDFTRMQVLPFDEAALAQFKSLRSSGVRIGTMDLRIAATSLSREFTLLTGNLGDFRKVAGLRAEDWSH
jgi:tRNA(fMet)-specific endonuclease VapC